MSSNGFSGVITPLLTPITADERVHEPSLRSLVDYQLNNGVSGLWAAGTTAEFASLAPAERIASIEIVADHAAGRAPVIANITMPSTALTIELGRKVAGSVGAVAATPPYYYPHSQEEIKIHYRLISEALGVPVWVYNIPQMHKTPVAPVTVADLADEGVVAGIKDSSGAGELLAELHALRAGRGFQLVSTLGTMLRATTGAALGAQGIIPGLANALPAIMSGAWEAGRAGDIEAARAFDDQIVAGLKLQTLGQSGSSVPGSVYSGLKAALLHMGVIETDHVTAPFKPLTEDERGQIPGILAGLGLGNGR
jgi:4-hydroxy-tetrahydrodipicolinate synthase